MSEEKLTGAPVIFAVCDTQEEYAEQLFGILPEKLEGDYQFHLFHDAGNMKEYLEHTSAEVILLGEECKEKTIREARTGQKIILTEDPNRRELWGYPCVFRYQPVGRIAGKINRILKKEEKKSRVRIRDEPVEKTVSLVRGLIGVYSPIHRIGKTRFALQLGQKIAKHVPVLYINMEGYAGGDYYFKESTDKDLGDLLYCIKQEQDNYGLKISMMAGQLGNLDYIKPMKNEQDLRAVSGGEWLSLLDLIFEKCIYETVILDLGDAVSGLYDVLKKCSRVYTLYLNEEAAQAKLRQYEENLRETGYASVLEHTVKKQVGGNTKRTEKTGAIQ